MHLFPLQMYQTIVYQREWLVCDTFLKKGFRAPPEKYCTEMPAGGAKPQIFFFFLITMIDTHLQLRITDP